MSNSNKNIYIEKNMFPNKNNQIIHNMNIFGRTNNKSRKINKIYYGLLILKVFLAFDVINSHCFKSNSTKNKYILYLLRSQKLHVPSFIIMSFFFTHNTLISLDSNKIYKRFERLLVPYLGFPLILFIKNNTLNYFTKYYLQIPIKILLLQIILGDAPKIPLHFWFLFDLIATTIIFLIIIMIFKNNYIFILQLLMLFSYFLQYSTINMKLFYKLKKQVSLGRENEFIPFAVTGFILFETDIINKLNKYKFHAFIISFIIFVLTGYYEFFSYFNGITYHGIKLNIRSICLIFLFSLFSIEETKYKYLIKFIKIITNYTGGIYYLHRIVQYDFILIFNDIKVGNFFGLCLIYLFSYIICFFGTFIFGNTRLKYLFI